MRRIRLNENQFNRLVNKCVKKALNEAEMQQYRTLNINGVIGNVAQCIDNCLESDTNTYGQGNEQQRREYFTTFLSILQDALQNYSVDEFLKY